MPFSECITGWNDIGYLLKHTAFLWNWLLTIIGYNLHYYTGVLSLEASGGAMASPEFGRSVNPISNYAHLITTGTPRFLDLPMALLNSLTLQFDI